MSGFEADWLALRAPADEAARAPATDALLGALPTMGRTLRVVDLGSGSGNNAVHLAPRLAALGARRQEWTLVDDDEALLERAVERVASLDLPADASLDASTSALDLANDAVPLEGADLATASALLDLASKDWIDRFVASLTGANVPAVLVALSVDGRVAWSPPDPFDGAAADLFHADMRRDKGLGIALADEAPKHFAAALERAGYRVERADSAWRLGASDRDLQRRYLDDVANVVIERGARADVEAWRHGRSAAIEGGTSRLLVGHVDLLGVLDPTSRSKSTSTPIA
ncbi:MAG: class I SAM-dependent methyltransferase [Planctomycetota bacterium]